MDLKEFTKQALIQIVEGTKEADIKLRELNAHVHTHSENFSGTKHYKNTDVEFDVAITTSETEGTNGGAGLKVASLMNIGGGVECKVENQTISRVKFTIPIILGTNR